MTNEILYKKVLGLFRALPLESMTIEWVCKYTNEKKENIHPILKLLVDQGHIKGKRKFRLTGKYLEIYKKYRR